MTTGLGRAEARPRALSRSSLPAGLIALTLALGSSSAASALHAPEAGTPAASDCKPMLDAPLNGQRAVDALAGNLVAVAARSGRTGRDLADTLRADPTLWVDRCGELFYEDSLFHEAEGDASAPSSSVDSAGWQASIPTVEAFTLHSRPGADRVIFLDFDGHLVSGTSWNTKFGIDAWFAPAFSIDSDPSFTEEERGIVIDVWQRVAQDYAPFDVDVTTQDPGPDPITRSSADDNQFGTRVLISPDQAQAQCYCAGRAYVNVFGTVANHAFYQPAWVYPQPLSNDPKYIADAASHEAGHTLNLDHDGTQTAAYYAGSGGWGPIMGSPYGQPVTQWSDGSYPNANNAEDDLSVISTSGAPLRADDVADDSANALALTIPGSVTAAIGDRHDLDRFSFTTAGGLTQLAAVPHWPGANLDLSLTLSSATGEVIATSAPVFSIFKVQDSTRASLDIDLPAGTYLVTIDGTGNGVEGSVGESDYGSVGGYALTISGNGTTPEPTATPTPSPTSTITSEPTATPTPSPTSTITSEPTATATTASPTPTTTTTSTKRTSGGKGRK